MVYLGMLFWHCHNYLTSWSYLFATLAIWVTSYIGRLFFLNWTNPFRMAWLIGDESAITVLPENAVKITIPTQVRWRPGQYVYIRMPGISVFENHPFTIASLCSEDFPSDYGEGYRDMIIVFRPFGGFTRKVFNTGIERGPWQTYRAFIDGPYGGMRRRLESFDKVVLIAGGSGITAIVSQLLDLIKRMRDGKALTQDVQVIWALKRPETLEWFKEELRICRECAPPESVRCQFFVTTAKRQPPRTHRMTAQTTQKHISTYLHDKVNDAFQGVAEKRTSYASKRNSAYIREEAEGDEEREKELRAENEDVIAALPRARVVTANKENNFSFPHHSTGESHSGGRDLASDIRTALESGNAAGLIEPDATEDENFDFGFPSTPTEFQKNLMRFAFLPAATRAADGWSTEYGRPDLPYMLRQMSKTWGKRTCVFVCGPPSMRVSVSNTVADLQKLVLGNSDKEEIFLHTENYAL
jgi:NAD(P)H-flavin reductase